MKWNPKSNFNYFKSDRRKATRKQSKHIIYSEPGNPPNDDTDWKLQTSVKTYGAPEKLLKAHIICCLDTWYFEYRNSGRWTLNAKTHLEVGKMKYYSPP